MRPLAGTLILMMLSVVAGCERREASIDISVSSGERHAVPIIIVSSYVLAEMCRELSDDSLDVRFPIPAGTSGFDWKPKLDDIRQLQSADLVMFSGAGYEPWSNNLSLPRSRLIDTSAGYTARLIPLPALITHQHGPKGGNAGNATAWATWLDPELAVAQLRSVEAQLKRVAPQFEAMIVQRANALANAYDNLDVRLRQIQADTAGRDFTIVTDGPFYFYLAQRLGWKFMDSPSGESEAFDDSKLVQVSETDNTVQRTVCLIRKELRSAEQVEFRDRMKVNHVAIVEIDLCEGAGSESKTIIERLSANLERIETAVKVLGEGGQK